MSDGEMAAVMVTSMVGEKVDEKVFLKVETMADMSVQCSVVG